jgi:hypothetical protein
MLPCGLGSEPLERSARVRGGDALGLVAALEAFAGPRWQEAVIEPDEEHLLAEIFCITTRPSRGTDRSSQAWLLAPTISVRWGRPARVPSSDSRLRSATRPRGSHRSWKDSADAADRHPSWLGRADDPHHLLGLRPCHRPRQVRAPGRGRRPPRPAARLLADDSRRRGEPSALGRVLLVSGHAARRGGPRSVDRGGSRPGDAHRRGGSDRPAAG